VELGGIERRGDGGVNAPAAGRVVVGARGRRRGLLAVALVAALAAAIGLALALSGVRRAPVGRPAPGFTLPSLNGPSVSLAALRGSDVVLRFGSVTCTLCDPDWSELAMWQTSGGPGLRVLAVEVGQPLSVVAIALGGVHPQVPVLVDPSGGVAAAYGVRSLPSVAFINRRGELVSVQVIGTRTGLWPAATWLYYLGRLRASDASPGGGSGG